MQDMRDFRGLLHTAIEKDLFNDPVALLFSGGTDSLTVLWTLLDLGARVTCYTFQLEHKISNDSRVSQIAACAWNVPLELIIIPHQNTKDLACDIRSLIYSMGSSRKTHVECVWPFTFLSEKIKERQVWTGLNADDLFGSSKSMAIRYGKDVSGFEHARKKLLNDPSTSGWKFINNICGQRGAELNSP